MKKYQLTVYQPDGEPPPPEVLGPIMDQLDALNREMQAAGVWVFAAALHPPEDAKVIRYRDQEVLVTDGPYTEGKEHIGGFTLIQAPDFDTALHWADRLARVLTLPIEVRPVMDD